MKDFGYIKNFKTNFYLVLLKPLNYLFMTAKTGALIWAFAFLAVGLLGFVNNPLIGESENAIFHADTVHNWVHIVSGVLFLLVALAAPDSAKGFLILFGIIYLGLGVLGIIQFGTEGMGKLLGFLHVNPADNYLHIALGALIALTGLSSRRTLA